MLLTFTLLALSIGAVWSPGIACSTRLSLHLWALLFAAAVVSGLVFGILAWPALVPLGVITAASLISRRSNSQVSRTILTLIAALTALALAVHALPGFNNPIVIEGVRLSPNASPFTQYANFDKGAAGLILLYFFCRRVQSIQDVRRIAGPVLVGTVLTSLAVMGYGLAVAYIEFDPKLPHVAPVFLAINLLFTCLAEEAFFRGLLQEKLTQILPNNWQWAAIAVSALLFGLAHFAGDIEYIALATTAGFGYSLVYATTRRVEAAVFTHFAVNAIHFFAFTYPHVAK